MMLNPNSALPLYQQLAEQLTQAIRRGDWAVQTRIPSENILAAQYKVGRPTVRQAIDVLVRRGLLRRRRGSGTFVQDQVCEVDLLSLGSTQAAFRAQGLEVSVQVREALQLCTQGAEVPIAGAECWYLSRLIVQDKTPLLYERFWLDKNYFHELDSHQLDAHSLTDLAWQSYHLQATQAIQQFEIVQAEDKLSQILCVDVGVCVLKVRRRIHFGALQDLVFSEIYCTTDRFKFTQTIFSHT